MHSSLSSCPVTISLYCLLTLLIAYLINTQIYSYLYIYTIYLLNFIINQILDQTHSTLLLHTQMRSKSQLSAQNNGESQSNPLVGVKQNPKATSPHRTLGPVPPNYDWYLKLNKSTLTPPQWVVTVVWTVLYTIMAISGYKYFSQNGFQYKLPVKLYSAMVISNLLYFPTFFWRKWIVTAWFIQLVTWMSTLMTMLVFQLQSLISFQLLIPLALWLTLAVFLHGYIVFYNMDQLQFENLRQMHTMYQVQPNYPRQLRQSWQDQNGQKIKGYKRPYDQEVDDIEDKYE